MVPSMMGGGGVAKVVMAMVHMMFFHKVAQAMVHAKASYDGAASASSFRTSA